MYLCQRAHFRALLRPDTATNILLRSSVEIFASLSFVPAYDGMRKSTAHVADGKEIKDSREQIQAPHAQSSSIRCSIITVATRQ
jgi:hypothetical protein